MKQYVISADQLNELLAMARGYTEEAEARLEEGYSTKEAVKLIGNSDGILHAIKYILAVNSR